MDRHAKKLQSVRDEGKFGDENFPDPSDEEDTEKEVRDIFIGEMEEEVFFHSSFNILSFIHPFILLLIYSSAQDPFNFDANPEKMDLDPDNFFKTY